MTTRRHTGGFTLVEVLIGATLLAIMMTLLTSALFTMTRSARAGELRMDEIEATQLVHAFLRKQIQNAFPLTERVDAEQRALFEGHSDRVRFVGHLPIVEGGGLQFVELAMSNGALTMRFSDAWPDAPFESSQAEWQSRVLLRDVRRLSWRYFGAPDEESPARWTDEWLGRDRLPELIRAQIQYDDGSVTAVLADVRVRTAVAQAALYREPPRSTR